MVFRILGTAAAEGWPGLFCVCDACKQARELGGKNIRRRATYQLGDKIRIDFGPDSYAQMIEYGLSYADLEHLLVTHSHQDHWYPQELLFRQPGFCKVPEGNVLHVYGNQRVIDAARRLSRIEECKVELHLLKRFEPVQLGDDVTATPIPADHAGDEEAFNFILDTPGGTILQANDTGWYADEVWEFLAERRLSLVVMDCTGGGALCRSGHLSVESVIDAKRYLEKLGALAADARFFATHFSHNGGLLHHELEKRFEGTGIAVAYDGLPLTLGG